MQGDNNMASVRSTIHRKRFTIAAATMVALMTLAGIIGALMINTDEGSEAFAVDGETYVISSGTDVTLGDGTNAAIPTTTSGAYTVKSTVTNGSTTYTVTAIAAKAFLNCTSLTKITLASTIVSIGGVVSGNEGQLEATFTGCTSLTEIALPTGGNTHWHVVDGMLYGTGERTLYYCPVAHSSTMTFASSLKIINWYAFHGYAGMTVALPTTVTNIYKYAFSDCPNLTTINLGSLTALAGLGEGAFMNSVKLNNVTVPSSVTTMNTKVFMGCIGLTTATLNATITALPDSTFSGCTGLNSVNIPTTYTAYGEFVFSGCQALTAYTFPEALQSVGNSAFQGTGLTEVTVPSTVTTLGTGVFSNSVSLTSATINAAITALPASTFSGCTALRSYTLVSTITTIGASAFSGCTSLFTGNTATDPVTFPAAISSIGASAFSGCTAIAYLSLTNNTNLNVGASAFSNCSGLLQIKVSDYITLNANALTGCNAIAKVTVINGDSPDKILKTYFQKGATLAGSGTISEVLFTVNYASHPPKPNTSGVSDLPIVQQLGKKLVLPTDSQILTMMDNNGVDKFDGYHLSSWNTAKDNSGTSIALGSEVTVNAFFTKLFAQWAANTVIVSLNKDSTAWDNQTVVLSAASGTYTKSSSSNGSYSFGPVNGAANRTGRTAVTYAVSVNSVNTGVTVTVNDNSPSATVNAYTITAADGTGYMAVVSSATVFSGQSATVIITLQTGYTDCLAAVGAAPVPTSLASTVVRDATAHTLSCQLTSVTATVTGVTVTGVAGNQCAITLASNGGTADGQATVRYGDSVVTAFSAPVWADYVNGGYYTAAAGGTQVLAANGAFASASVSGYVTGGKWSLDSAALTLSAHWTLSCPVLSTGGYSGTAYVGGATCSLAVSVTAVNGVTYTGYAVKSGTSTQIPLSAVGTASGVTTLQASIDNQVASSGNYELTVSATTTGFAAVSSMKNATVTIAANQLSAATGLTWGTGAAAGTAQWTAVSPILAGTDTVSYIVQLYDGATPVTTVAGVTGVSCDLLTAVQQHGAASYSFQVTAVSSDPADIASSAAAVSVDKAAYAVTLPADGTGYTVARTSASNIVMTGESYAFEINVLTGYDTAWQSVSASYSGTGTVTPAYSAKPTVAVTIADITASGTVAVTGITANKYTVAFAPGDGTGTMADQEFTYDVAQALTPNSFTKSGDFFYAWSNGDQTYIDGQTVMNLAASGTVTLTAVWRCTTQPVTLTAEHAELAVVSGITGGNAQHEVPVVVTAKADLGYQYLTVGYTVDGVFTELTAVGGQYTVPGDAIVGPLTISAAASAIPAGHIYQVSVQPVYGAYVHLNQTTVRTGGTLSFSVSPSDGYEVTGVTASSGHIDRYNGAYRLSGVTADTVITVTVAPVGTAAEDAADGEDVAEIAAAAACVIVLLVLCMLLVAVKRR